MTSNYPAGAQYLPNCPWNAEETETATCVICRSSFDPETEANKLNRAVCKRCALCDVCGKAATQGDSCEEHADKDDLEEAA